MPCLRITTTTAVLGAMALAAFAQEREQPRPGPFARAASAASGKDSFVVEVKPLTSALADRATPMIVHGREVDPNEYPSSFQATADGKVCTWFLVGPQVLLSAAHCVVGVTSKDPVAQVKLPIGDKIFVATCDVSAEYWKDASQDWAACKVGEPVPVPGAVGLRVAGFEVLDVDPDDLLRRPQVEISGFGCVVAGGGPVEGYRIGTARVTGVPPDVRVPGSAALTPNAIKLEQSPSLLCKGDSGGPAFFYRRDRVHRGVIGINSSTALDAGRSYLASVGTERAKAFLDGWARDKKVTICGLHSQAKNCRPF